MYKKDRKYKTVEVLDGIKALKILGDGDIHAFIDIESDFSSRPTIFDGKSAFNLAMDSKSCLIFRSNSSLFS